jgi:hypothetical protein
MLPEGTKTMRTGSLRQTAAWTCGAVLALLLAAVVHVGGSRARYSDDPVLDRAARALVALRSEPRVHPALSLAPGRTIVAAPPAYDGAAVVRLATHLAALVSDTRRALGAATDGDNALRARSLAAGAPALLAGFLRSDLDPARTVLYAFGLPQVDLAATDGSALVVWPLTALPSDQLREACDLARAAPAWRRADLDLAQRLGLTPEQRAGVRCRLVQQALDNAFTLPGGTDRAASALGRYADLAPVQAEAVLAMAATLVLLRAGDDGQRAFLAVRRARGDLAEVLDDIIDFMDLGRE